jgi:hypothetical protein
VMLFLSTSSFDLSADAEPTLGQRPTPVPPSLPLQRCQHRSIPATS